MTVKLSGSGGTSVISSDARIGLDLDRRVQEAARLESNGRLDEAESILRRLLGNHPRHHPAWNALAILAFRRGDLPGAVEATEKALEIDAKQSLYWRNLCEMRRRKGDLVGAIDAGRRAVRLAPTDPEALFNLALAQNDAAEFDLAITNLRRLLQFAPEHGRGWNNLGHALLAKGLVLEARDACERAVRIDATNAEAFYNLGIIERRLDDAGGAARHFERALSLRPDFAQARDQLGEMTATGAQAPESPDEWNSLGITHWSDGRYEEALAAYEAALALNPNFLPSIANAATCLADLGRIRDAADLARRGLAIDPTVSSIRLVLGHCQLELGDWEEGWRNYEARFSGAHEVQTGRTTYADFPIPRWNGEAGTENLSILVVIEQGYGDVIQFSRYLDLLLERFARVGLACSAPLLRLMEWSYGERVAMLPHMPGGFENWDRVIALMSLPLVFGTTLATVPATVPYLRVPAVERLLWKERIDRVLPGGASHRARLGRPTRASSQCPPFHRFRGIVAAVRSRGRHLDRSAAARRRRTAAVRAHRHPLDRLDRRILRLRHHGLGDRRIGPGDLRRHRDRPSGGKSRRTGLDARSLRQRVAVDGAADRQPVVSDDADLPSDHSRRLARGGRTGGRSSEGVTIEETDVADGRAPSRLPIVSDLHLHAEFQCVLQTMCTPHGRHCCG